MQAVSKIPVSDNEEKSEQQLKDEAALDSLNQRYCDLFNRYERVKKEYGTNCPWISLYRSFDGSQMTTKYFVNKYLDRVVCDRYGNIEVVLREQESKKRFPLEQIMEG